MVNRGGQGGDGGRRPNRPFFDGFLNLGTLGATIAYGICTPPRVPTIVVDNLEPGLDHLTSALVDKLAAKSRFCVKSAKSRFLGLILAWCSMCEWAMGTAHPEIFKHFGYNVFRHVNTMLYPRIDPAFQKNP